MNNKKQILSTIIAVFMMLLFILDTDTARTGVKEGLTLCMNVIIPSLFPFLIVSLYMNSSVQCIKIPGMRHVGKCLHIPSGCESILLLGLTGGYPVGAQLIANAYEENRISKRCAHILLGYCNNAGPAFIFGMTASLFSSPVVPFLLWAIHIFSALATGSVLPKPEEAFGQPAKTPDISVILALKRSIYLCAVICGWVIIFKVFLSYISNYFSGILNHNAMICLCGLLELSNGCVLLAEIPSEALRFVLCSVFLSFGGFCVMLQTASAAQLPGLGLYIPGKLIQTIISILASLAVSRMIFKEKPLHFPELCTLFIVGIVVLLSMKKYAEKRCGNIAKNHV